MALVSSQFLCRNAEFSHAAGKENVRSETNKQRTAAVAYQIGDEQQHSGCHRTHTHTDDPLADGVLCGNIAIFHESADDQADGSKQQILGCEGKHIEWDRQG